MEYYISARKRFAKYTEIKQCNRQIHQNRKYQRRKVVRKLIDNTEDKPIQHRMEHHNLIEITDLKRINKTHKQTNIWEKA